MCRVSRIHAAGAYVRSVSRDNPSEQLERHPLLVSVRNYCEHADKSYPLPFGLLFLFLFFVFVQFLFCFVLCLCFLLFLFLFYSDLFQCFYAITRCREPSFSYVIDSFLKVSTFENVLCQRFRSVKSVNDGKNSVSFSLENHRKVK